MIDDHQDLLAVLVEQLAHAGWRVRGFSTVEEALPFVRASLPDVVLTDINVGRLTGAALARELRLDRATAGIPIVAMSGTTEPSPHMLSLFDYFTTKPVELAAMSDLLHGVIAKRAAR